jgi:ABC-type Fe3+/spermidine/putrescine transport system ATPase subunit
VTHDQDEAMSMGDRLVVLDHGRIQQIGSPEDLYRTPRNAFVASFIGQANFIEGHAERDRSLFVARSGLSIVCAECAAGALSLMIRPEAVELLDAPAPGVNVFPATVEVVTYLGSTSELILRLTDSETIMVTKAASTAAPRAWAPGQKLYVRVDPACAVGIAPT